MNTIHILCGVVIGILGFINFYTRRIYKSQGNKRMTAIGTILVMVSLVYGLLSIIWGYWIR